MIPNDFVRSLLSKIDIVDIIGLRVSLQKKSKSNYFANCPFHNEKTPSFSVSQPKQIFYCFGCGAKGNAIDFLMQLDKLSFPEVIEQLASHAGVMVPHTTHSLGKSQASPDWYTLLSAIAVFYGEQLQKNARAMQYVKQRQLTAESIKLFQIGYAPAGWDHLLQLFGKTAEAKQQLAATGMLVQREEGGYYDRFRDRIIFPILDKRGRLIAFGARSLGSDEPKYINSPETVLFQKGQVLYGLFQVIQANRQIERLIIVEGYMDVIALHQHGLTQAVAAMGTALTVSHFQQALRVTQHIIFCFDGDNAGRTAAWRALQTILPFMNDAIQVRFLFLPNNEDPDSFLHQKGKTAFEKLLAEALSFSHFFFQTLSKQEDLSSLNGRAHFMQQASQLLLQMPDSFFRQMLLEELSKKTGVKHPAARQKVIINRQKHPIRMPSALRLAMTLLVQYPGLGKTVSMIFHETTQPGLALLSELITITKENPDLHPAQLLEYFRDRKESHWLAQLAQIELMIPESGLEAEFLGALRRVQQQNNKQLIQQLLAKAASDSLSNDEKIRLTALIAEKEPKN